MKTTVIISSVNRQEGLQRLLANLGTQSAMPDEVIIVEAGNATWTKEDLPALFQNKTVVHHAPGESLASSRDRGRRSASGDILVYLDDDVIIPSNYIENALLYLSENAQVMAVGGVYDDASTLNRRNWSIVIGRLFGIYGDGTQNRVLPNGWADYVRGEYAERETSAEWLFGCNWVIRAKAFDHPKVKIERKLAAWSFLEDVMFGHRLTSVYGQCMRVLPALRVVHDAPVSAGHISPATLRMRILYRYIFWRDYLQDGRLIRASGFWIGMLANLLLMLKQEPKFWVIFEHIRTIKFAMKNNKLSIDFANDFIFS